MRDILFKLNEAHEQKFDLIYKSKIKYKNVIEDF